MVVGASCVFRRCGLAVAALFAGLLSAPLTAIAVPLDKDACGKLQSEKQSLVMLGVDKEFSKGPEWAKANLQQAQLDQVKRYLTIEEQLKFRCGMAMVSLTAPAVDEPEDGDDNDAAAAPAAAAVAPTPVPERREETQAPRNETVSVKTNETVLVKPGAKPAATPAAAVPVKTQPAPAPVVKPAAPAAKPAPKPAAAKAQSSWNAETTPLDPQPAATTPPEVTKPKSQANDVRG